MKYYCMNLKKRLSSKDLPCEKDNPCAYNKRCGYAMTMRKVSPNWNNIANVVADSSIADSLLEGNETNKIADLSKLVKRYIAENDKLKIALVAVKAFHKAETVTPKDFDELMYKIHVALNEKATCPR